MRLIIQEDGKKASEWTARYIVKVIRDFNPNDKMYFILGLAVGKSLEDVFRYLVQYNTEGKVSFQYVKAFNMDEYVKLPRDHPSSHSNRLFNKLFKHVDINPHHVHMLDGNATDLQEECDQFEKKMKQEGGVDLFLCNIWDEGQVGFNAPGSSFASRTRAVELSEYMIPIVAENYFTNRVWRVPQTVLTVGIGTLMELAKEVVILASGTNRARTIRRAVEMGVNNRCLMSAFQQHQKATLICDTEASIELRVKTVKSALKNDIKMPNLD